MEIDKSTGRGCAWSIASKTITKKLIEEHIIDKLISRKSPPKRNRTLRVIERSDGVYVISQGGNIPAEEPLWTPSFIREETWAQAVSRFRRFERLDRSVEMYLLPEMGEYLQNIPDAELISITRDFLIEQGVINSPICQREGGTYYFDENEIYSLDEKSEQFLYEKWIKFHHFKIEYETCFNMNVWRKAVSQFEIGMTLNECIGIFLKTKLIRGVPQGLSPVDQLVQYIAPPVFERVPENKDAATFDRIRMTVGLPCYKFNTWEALQGEVNMYQNEIYQRVIQKLEKDHHFERYGVPINFLRLSDVTLLRDFSIEFIFELKEPGISPLPNDNAACP